eukprot:389547-Rhodomonas_salina.3
MPSGVRATCVTIPLPLHCAQLRFEVPGFIPEPCAPIRPAIHVRGPTKAECGAPESSRDVLLLCDTKQVLGVLSVKNMSRKMVTVAGGAHSAGGASLQVRDADLLVSAEDGLLEVDFEIQPQIISVLRALRTASTARTTHTTLSTKESLEDVPERAEVAEVREARAASASCPPDASLAELVVQALLLRVREHLIRLEETLVMSAPSIASKAHEKFSAPAGSSGTEPARPGQDSRRGEAFAPSGGKHS